ENRHPMAIAQRWAGCERRHLMILALQIADCKPQMHGDRDLRAACRRRAMGRSVARLAPLVAVLMTIVECSRNSSAHSAPIVHACSYASFNVLISSFFICSIAFITLWTF